MSKLTYKQAFDKLEIAYLKGEVNPYDPRFCFCGNLENSSLWNINRSIYRGIGIKLSDLSYSYREYKEMELAFMEPIKEFHLSKSFSYIDAEKFFRSYSETEKVDKEYEDALFRGFCDALEVLKRIHKERGEDVENDLIFNKRVEKPKFEKILV